MADQDIGFGSVLERMAQIVGPAYALRAGIDIEPFVTERRGNLPGITSLVLRPGSVDEVSRILRLASETGTPIVPQGGNTGLVGGGVPDRSGRQLVLSLSRLNRIREIDVASSTITAEAGVILETLHAEADAVDRLFPLHLASQGSCAIGGNLATNAGGVSVLAYGNARDLCLGLEVVLPTGEVLDDLRKLKKDNTGYDLKNLFIGAEGTLGVITAAVLKLYPKPRGRDVAFVALRTPQHALDLFHRAYERAGPNLTAFELMGDQVLEFGVKHHPGARAVFNAPWPWQVLIEVSSGRSAEESRATLEEILGEALEAGIVEDAVLAESLAQFQAFWALREGLSDAQRPEGVSIKHDISVPVASIPRFIELAEPAVRSVDPASRICCFGHMGDGNLHYNISQPAGVDGAAFKALSQPMNEAVHTVVRALDGSISAEHGIGQLKRDELDRTAPPVALDLMRRIRRGFDPAGIMNPGKLLKP